MFGLVSVLLWQRRRQPQRQSPITASPRRQGERATRSSEHYRIGPGDVLDVRVFNKPQFSRDGVRVDGRGMIRMPFIDGEIQAACMTEQQLADDIGTRYVVTCAVRRLRFHSRVSVAAFPCSGRARAQPLSTSATRASARAAFLCRGPTENAGRTIQIVHTTTSAACNDAVSWKRMR